MWFRIAGYGAASQFIAVILLTGCADTQVVAVKTEIASPPSSCRTAPKTLPKLPDRAMRTGELATSYNKLQAQYRREAGRFRLCQRYVARLR